MPDILLCILLFMEKPRKEKNNLQLYVGKAVISVFYSILILGVISSLISFTPMTATIWGVRQFFRYGLMAYMILLYFRPRDIVWGRKLLYQSFLWNMFFVIVEFALGQTGDAMGGTFSGNGELSVYLTVIAFIAEMEYLQHRLSIQKFIAACCLCFATSILAELKLLYILLPLTLYGGYVLLNKFNIKHVIILVIAYFSMIPVMKFALLLYYDENYVESVFDKEEMDKYLENDYGLQSGTYRLLSFNRNTCIERSSIILSQESKTFLIGNGIGSLTQSQLFKTPLAKMYFPTFYFFFTFSYILLELGWLGFILFLLFYALIAYRFYRYYQNTKDSIIKYWSSIGLFMACVSYIFMWYNAVPYSAYYFPFILFSLCFVGIKFRKQKLSMNKYINKNGSKSICHRPRV
ncbi:putative membrane protein [Bacteroides fragilis str. 3988T(B)14]|uniref:Putative membrane protein n=2 Tax=Bacteroides fragilis TaxID=817 RepID=A0A015UTL6_BACFG|nr:putative membrane protein [Bacteroides fragilis str. 3988T(B)14]